jgi:hypothetical protein
LTNKKKYVLVVRKEKKTPTIKETSRKKIRWKTKSETTIIIHGKKIS